jgi:hypothetical protein
MAEGPSRFFRTRYVGECGRPGDVRGKGKGGRIGHAAREQAAEVHENRNRRGTGATVRVLELAKLGRLARLNQRKFAAQRWSATETLG